MVPVIWTLWRADFFVILDCFLHFYPLPTLTIPTALPPHPPKKKIEKMKKLAGDIIILHTCTINNNHLIYGSWDIERIGTWSFFFGTYGLLTGFKLGKKSSFTECLGFVKYWFEKTFDTETVQHASICLLFANKNEFVRKFMC